MAGYDVIIIGGGPAGSSIGSYLSQAGISNLVLESEIFPREHVGESLVMTTVRNFQDLGLLPVMESGEYVRKYGASWHAPNGKEFSIDFADWRQEGIHQTYTYHVDRAKFDLELLKNAQKLGSKVLQGVHVKQVLFEGSKAVGVRVNVAGTEIDIPAKLIVDASGRGTVLGNQLKMKKKDPIFDQYAVHSWFTDLDRGDGETADYIHIYFLPIERGWVWSIPINEKITSVGVVADKKVFRDNFNDLETYFYGNTKTNPGLEHSMRNAKRIKPFKTEGDYSYKMDKFVGDSWMLVGDAARFVDPIFSSGVSVALNSGKFAAEQIIKVFESGDFSEAALKPYETKLLKGVEIWYEFIRLYYKLLPLFTHFIQSKKHRLEVLRLLQGEVFDRTEVPVLDAMREYIAKVEKTEGHLLRENLTAIPYD